jgi:hypothetical protein
VFGPESRQQIHHIATDMFTLTRFCGRDGGAGLLELFPGLQTCTVLLESNKKKRSKFHYENYILACVDALVRSVDQGVTESSSHLTGIDTFHLMHFEYIAKSIQSAFANKPPTVSRRNPQLNVVVARNVPWGKHWQSSG